MSVRNVKCRNPGKISLKFRNDIRVIYFPDTVTDAVLGGCTGGGVSSSSVVSVGGSLCV